MNVLETSNIHAPASIKRAICWISVPSSILIPGWRARSNIIAMGEFDPASPPRLLLAMMITQPAARENVYWLELEYRNREILWHADRVMNRRMNFPDEDAPAATRSY